MKKLILIGILLVGLISVENQLRSCNHCFDTPVLEFAVQNYEKINKDAQITDNDEFEYVCTFNKDTRLSLDEIVSKINAGAKKTKHNKVYITNDSALNILDTISFDWVAKNETPDSYNFQKTFTVLFKTDGEEQYIRYTSDDETVTFKILNMLY